MSVQESHIPQSPSPSVEPSQSRPAGGTENSWCRAVPGGTGITVLALLLSKTPDIQLLQNALHRLQRIHPILKSKLRCDPTLPTPYSYVVPSTPHLQIETFDLASTSEILQGLADPDAPSVSTLHHILEHELNRNSWRDGAATSAASASEADVFFASLYTLSGDEWAVVVRLHTSVCDRTTAVSLLRELLRLTCGKDGGGGGGGFDAESEQEMEVRLGIEDYVPRGKGDKPFWARGADVLGYSLNSFRLSNLNFKETQSPRSSRVIRLQLNSQQTQQILSLSLQGCQARNIKLCGVLAAAGLIAAHSSKSLPDNHWEKYAVVTLIDCRSILDPVLSSSDYGFYHSAVLNTHDIKGGEGLWELAVRTHNSYANATKSNKHFTDIADVNFLMCKAIENPGLTPSSSLRTALLSVFEEPVIDRSNHLHGRLGLEDYIGCASSHGVGPSIAMFDTIIDDQLDCACVYPSPLHSRRQMQELVEEMKRILVEGSNHPEIN